MGEIAVAAQRLVDDYVTAYFPESDTVVVAGSTASGACTASSDIDVLVLGPAAMFPGSSTSRAATDEHGGRLVETFAYTPEAYRWWAERELAAHRPVILTMLVEGVPLRRGPTYDGLRSWAADLLAVGPQIDPHAPDLRRYALSAQLDDLADAADPTERSVLLTAVFQSLAAFLLLSNAQWLGTDKWLVRRLREWDPHVAELLSAALLAADTAAMLSLAKDLLQPHGGTLQAGFVR